MAGWNSDKQREKFVEAIRRERRKRFWSTVVVLLLALSICGPIVYEIVKSLLR